MRERGGRSLERTGTLQSALVHLLLEGSISVPVLLLREYKNIGLTEKEVMLLIHLILCQEKEQNFLPSIQLLESRMSISYEEISHTLHRLVQSGFLDLEDAVDETGLRTETYSLAPLYKQLSVLFIEKQNETEETSEETKYQSLFQLFEREFGRTLSPFECETLSRWMDEDGFSEELIEASLREAVFSGKVSFRYIDRILLEWQRNGIQNAEQAMEYSRRFRQQGVLYKSVDSSYKEEEENFSFYNWVNQD